MFPFPSAASSSCASYRCRCESIGYRHPSDSAFLNPLTKPFRGQKKSALWSGRPPTTTTTTTARPSFRRCCRRRSQRRIIRPVLVPTQPHSMDMGDIRGDILQSSPQAQIPHGFFLVRSLHHHCCCCGGGGGGRRRSGEALQRPSTRGGGSEFLFFFFSTATERERRALQQQKRVDRACRVHGPRSASRKDSERLRGVAVDRFGDLEFVWELRERGLHRGVVQRKRRRFPRKIVDDRPRRRRLRRFDGGCSSFQTIIIFIILRGRWRCG